MHKKSSALVVGTLLLATVGCSEPARHPVTGRVTMDGENLPDAIVSFMPNDKTLDPAVGTTDADGVYVLTQSVDREGLLAGTYAVRITTYRDAITDAEPMIPGVRERVPKKYNVETTLTVDVPNESGGYDFELDSDGPIFRIESL